MINIESVKEYYETRSRIKLLLNELLDKMEQDVHEPATIHYGHVGDLRRMEMRLLEIKEDAS